MDQILINTQEKISPQVIKYANEMNIQKFNASACWLDCFTKRYGFNYVNIYGEIGSIDHDFEENGEEM